MGDPGLTAKQVLAALAAKHREDVFVPECKMGPTHYAEHLRLDAWAMARSWKHPAFVGYEIKVSRADFIRDDKWTAYGDGCSHLYLVTPWGMVDPSEVPAVAGMLWVTKTGARCVTKKKAPRREPDPSALRDVMMYVLMSRSEIVRSVDRGEGFDWEEWLERRGHLREVGHRVSRTLSRQYAEDVQRVELEHKQLERAVAGCREVVELLVGLGVDPTWGGLRRHVEQEIERMVADGVGPPLPRRVRAGLERLRLEVDLLLGS